MFDVKKEALALQNEIMNWRRFIHQHPETELILKETVDFVCEKLSEFGADYKRLGDHGALCTVKGNKPGRTIALRADMDALPAAEENDLEFRSVYEGKAHLCGHDGHTAMLLGAAKLLNEHKNEFCGTVQLIFQPGEECGKGASLLINEYNVLKDVDSIFGIHLTTPAESGCLFYTVGPAMASMGKFDIKIIGKGAHGAMPHFSIDPVVIAAEFINAVQTIVARNIDPAVAAVVTIGKITGGSTYNVIPDFVELSGTFRAVSKSTTEQLKTRLKEVLEGVCKIHNASYEIDLQVLTPALENPAEFTHFAVGSAQKIVGEKIVNIPVPIMAGEDFAYYLEKIPGCFVSLGAGTEAEGYAYPMHNPKVKFNENVFWMGTAIHTQVALDFLSAE